MSKSLRSPRHRRLQRFLAQIRAEAGLTQTQLADRLRRPQSFVAKYEGGERRLDVIEFVSVVEALGIDPVDAIAQLLTKNQR